MQVLKQNTHQAKQTNHARRLPTHTKMVGDQPNDHSGLDIIEIN